MLLCVNSSSASCPKCRSQLHRQQTVPVSRKRSTRETISKILSSMYTNKRIINCVFIISIASVGSCSESDDGVIASGSGLSVHEVNQALTRSSLHSVKHPRRK